MAPARKSRETIFQVRCETGFGEEVRLVGSTEALGRWDPARGLRLETSPKLYPNWRSRATSLLEEGQVEYKYIICVVGQEATWETCANRVRPPAWREASDECSVIQLQHTFNDADAERVVQLRPFPDRRAFSNLRKATLGLGRGACFRMGGLGCYEEPAGGRAALEEYLAAGDSSCSRPPRFGSGMTRASSSDSVGLLEEVAEDGQGASFSQQLLVWTPSVSASAGAVSSVDAFGSFTKPAWTKPLALHLCPETGVWWLAVEEALPRLQPGAHEFKFRLNGEEWATNPALPVRRSPEGAENNTLVIDRRLLARIERRSGRAPDANGAACAESTQRQCPHCPRGQAPAAAAAVQSAARAGVLQTQLPLASADEKMVVAAEAHSPAGEAPLPPEERAPDRRTAAPRRLPPRRAATAERLCHALDEDGAPSSPDQPQQRTTSLPYLFSGCEASSLSILETLAGVSEENELYGSDVSLLLELPNVKRRTGLSLSAGAFYKPKHGAGDGEDAHFLELPALGVADGVGGLQHILGHNSKAFAEDLMARCRESSARLDHHLQGLSPEQAAKQILCEGYSGVEEYGAATAAIARLDCRTNKLGIAVLGDSGVMVIRRPTSQGDQACRRTRSFVAFKSPSQQHDFNKPFQLCRVPAAKKKFLLCGPDKPTDCITFEVDVEEGDLILCYSDGVDDNLRDQEILDICDRALSPYAAHVLGIHIEDATASELLSRAIGSAAHARSRDEKARTPFSEEAKKAGWPTSYCRGGKEDDITCLAAWVQYCPSVDEASAQCP